MLNWLFLSLRISKIPIDPNCEIEDLKTKNAGAISSPATADLTESVVGRPPDS